MGNKFRRLYAIPDMHGRLDLLDQALELLHKEGYLPEKDLLIFLGDMIDRGPNSKGILDRIISLTVQYPENVIALRGNHENLAVNANVKGTNEYNCLWYMNGGRQTERSYPNCRMSEEHVKFIATLPTSFEVQGFYFSHAPVPRETHRIGSEKLWREYTGVPGEQYTIWEKTWYYFPEYEEASGQMMDKHEGPRSEDGTGEMHLIGVCGHIHRGKGAHNVRLFPNYRMLDCGAGCFYDSPLAIHECISGVTQYVSSVSKPNEGDSVK